MFQFGEKVICIINNPLHEGSAVIGKLYLEFLTYVPEIGKIYTVKDHITNSLGTSGRVYLIEYSTKTLDEYLAFLDNKLGFSLNIRNKFSSDELKSELGYPAYFFHSIEDGSSETTEKLEDGLAGQV